MPSYDQWRRSLDKGQVARVTWLCGDQKILVEEVIDSTKEFLKISEFDYFSMSGESNSLKEIWDAAYQYSLDPEANRLVLIREADKVSDWSPLKKWFASSRHLISTYLMFVSDEPDYPTIPDTKGELQEHVDLIRTKGKAVKCSALKQSELESWIIRNSKLGLDTARFLADRAGSDMHSVANVCRKSMLFKSDPGKQVVSQMVQQYSNQSFADALIFLDKKMALTELERVPEAEYSKIIGQLYSRLDTLNTLHRAVPNFNTIKELCEATGVKFFLAQKYSHIAKKYDKVKLQGCRNALTVVDDAVQRNATTGAMELLVALW